MARIRSIKPEFWSSPGIENVTPHARLLFIAMWGWADDNGVGVANPRELLGFAFPLDEELTVVDLRRMLEEIRRVFGVMFYAVERRPYYSIPSWEKHQKFDRRSKGKYPTIEEADSHSDQPKSTPSTESHESPSSARRDSVAGTGEQGNRGTGEQYSLSPDKSGDRGELIPDDWKPNQAHNDKAASLNLDVHREHERFVKHANRNVRRMRNWNTGFTNWLRKSAEFNQQQGVSGTTSRQSRMQSNLQLVRELEAEEMGAIGNE